MYDISLPCRGLMDGGSLGKCREAKGTYPFDLLPADVVYLYSHASHAESVVVNARSGRTRVDDVVCGGIVCVGEHLCREFFEEEL